jgi:hypothetical protein
VETTPEALQKMVKRLRAVADPKLHHAVVDRFLDASSAGEVVEAIRLLMADVDRPGFRAAYQAVVSFFVLRGGLRYRRTEELYRAAFSAGYAPVKFLLLRAPPVKTARDDEVLPDPELLEVPLGIRKTMARGNERDMLLRLIRDPSVPVVQIILQNPKVLESDVVRLAARRPNTVPVLESVAKHSRWNSRYEVLRALVQNPYTPTSLAVSLVPFMVGKHLREVAQDNRLHSGLRASALDISSWREMRRRGAIPTEKVGTRH